MPDFGVNRASLSVTDLDRSHRFYAEVLGFVMLMDVGDVRLYLHDKTIRPGSSSACTNTTRVGAGARDRRKLSNRTCYNPYHKLSEGCLSEQGVELGGEHCSQKDGESTVRRFRHAP